MVNGSSGVLDPLLISPAWSLLSPLCQQLETMTCLPLDSLNPPVWHLSLMTQVYKSNGLNHSDIAVMFGRCSETL